MFPRAGFHITTEHSIPEGNYEAFEKAIFEVVAELEKTELKTLEYLVHVTDDHKSVRFVQWYESAEAFLEHLLEGGKDLGAALEGKTEFVKSWIYTDQVTDEIREAIASYGTAEFVVFAPAITGYRRYQEAI